MTNGISPADADFSAVTAALHRGDFSALDPLFALPPPERSPLVDWVREGKFAVDRPALNETLTCACFNGRTAWIPFLLEHGADLVAGARTGLNALHWAANRGQLEAVCALVERGAPLELRNAYGGTVLGATMWAAVHEPRPAHLEIVATLLEAGADAHAVDYPSGIRAIDALLKRYRDGG